MYPSSSDRLLIRQYLILLWLMGAAFIAAGLFVAPRHDGLIFGAILLLLGAVLGLCVACFSAATPEHIDELARLGAGVGARPGLIIILPQSAQGTQRFL